MKVLLLGKNGQVGWELQRSLVPLGEVIALGSDQADFTQLDELANTVQTIQPAIIVNAAAHTAVDKAESEPELARTINALAPKVLAEYAKQNNAWLMHYSTDYVFDGSGDKPWRESDSTAPLSVYGATKLEGEHSIQQSGCKHLIFRTSWVYGARGGNFAKTMLRLAQERDSMNVINDQIGAPTGADLLADITAHAIRIAQQDAQVSGLYHLVAGGETSWFDYAKFVLSLAQRAEMPLKVTPEKIQPVPTRAFPTPAKRPHNSRLDTTKLQRTFDLCLPDWRVGVMRMLSEVLQRDLVV